ncbi:MAG TPA: hypothetical protein DD473_22610 [Planctomycetaceae bacterium]|nr:hypothetical protein [Planctomycetaceae bacterium]
MSTISDEDLLAYADELLNLVTASTIEAKLRKDSSLRERLQALLDGRDSGSISIGEVWRHGRISCPSRSEMGLYLMNALEAERLDYVAFHLESIGCAYCQATLEELKTAAESLELNAQDTQRRERLFASSAGFLQSRSASE